MKNLHLYDFGIFIELAPDEEEKQLLENNIQVALSKENILDQIEKAHKIDLPDNLVQQELALISQGLKKEDVEKIRGTFTFEGSGYRFTWRHCLNNPGIEVRIGKRWMSDGDIQELLEAIETTQKN